MRAGKREREEARIVEFAFVAAVAFLVLQSLSGLDGFRGPKHPR